MLHEIYEIDIPYETLGVSHTGNKATITTYIKDIFPNDQEPFNRPLIVIIPGGGYHHHSPREGEAIAIKMLELGYNAVVLRYSLMPNIYPTQLAEAAYTMKFVRDRASEWDVNPDNIIVAGFSAGGHIAAGLGNFWNREPLKSFAANVLNVDSTYIRPDGLMLGYPVITSGKSAHRLSFERLLGERYDELVDELSLENSVTPDTPECFIWHTFEDQSVPLENSLLFANALRNAGVLFEYHVFVHGEHGLALGTRETATKNGKHYQPEVFVWTDLFSKWMEHIHNNHNKE